MLLENSSEENIDAFKKDFSEMFRIAAGLNKQYSRSAKDFDANMPKFKSLVNLFNKKYKNIHLDIIHKREEADFKLGVFVKSSDVRHIFSEEASKIKGLTSIGVGGFNEVGVSETANFPQMVSGLQDKVYLSYFDPEKGASNFFIEYDQKKKMAEIICSYDELTSGPAFELCACYALKDFDKKINIYEKSVVLSFVDEMTDQERRDWEKKFYPYFGE